MNLLIEIMIVSVIGLLGLVYVLRKLRHQQKQLDLQLEELRNCMSDLSVRMERYEIAVRRQSREREAVVSSSLNQLQTDLKLMQMKNNDQVSGRDSPEVLAQAIQLAREGKPGDQIMRRTGLPMDVIDAITMLHSAKPRH